MRRAATIPRRLRAALATPQAALLGLLALAGTAAVVVAETELGTARDLHGQRYVRAEGCTRCHTNHAASFGRTFHRTMTQEARGAAVRAPFAGEAPTYFGVPARMDTAPDGTKRMHLGGDGIPTESVAVALTVGSRRYQQYIGRAGDALVRLPFAYHLEEKRWFHMNGAFLTPDPAPTAAGLEAADFSRHVTRWNDNCIFCHNVGGVPGLRQSAHGPAFDSRVEEYGIACEACHGPGEAHARENANPYRRYRLHLGEAADPSIVNPRRLAQDRSLDVCGRCHGQRITDDVSRFLRRGDPFVPGDDLSLYSAPLWRDTALDGEHGSFAARFWDDGTPRLTAYEYQGVLSSRCAVSGELTCLSCHTMHGGDPRGQLRDDRKGDALCTQCHAELAPAAARAAHGQHRDVACVDCHMPKIVYGVMASHRSHRIERPRPARDAAAERPDACTLCHADESRAWAAAETARRWPHGSAGGALAANPGFSQLEVQLFAGDPVVRALSAAAYAEPGLAGASGPRVHALLLEVMDRDPYPGVRHLAFRSLLARLDIAPEQGVARLGYEPEWPSEARARAVAALRSTLPHAPLDPSALASLRAASAARAIDIGE